MEDPEPRWYVRYRQLRFDGPWWVRFVIMMALGLVTGLLIALLLWEQ